MSIFGEIGGLVDSGLNLYRTFDNPDGQTRQKQMFNFNEMVRAAQKAGLSPLTVLGAGAGGSDWMSTAPPLPETNFGAIGASIDARNEPPPPVDPRVNQQIDNDLEYQRQAIQGQILENGIRAKQLLGTGTSPDFRGDDKKTEGYLNDIFGNPQKIGVGSKASDVENEYGETADIEGFFRYIRDRVGEPVANLIRGYTDWRNRRQENNERFLDDANQRARRY